jgi:ribosome biogenesis GTPase A
MTKTRRLIRENLPLVGLVIEVADARAPRATRHPGLKGLVGGRPVLTVLGKADLAEPSVTRRWVEFLGRTLPSGDGVAVFSGGRGREVRTIAGLARELGRTRSPRAPVRAMVVGLPNVGKSTLINRLCGRASARTGDRPGVTRGKQWLRAGDGLELLDLPGILVPGRLAEPVALRLALLGVLPEHAFEVTQVALLALDLLTEAGRLPAELRHGEESAAPGLLERFAEVRGHLRSGGRPDLERAAAAVVREFREGRFGGFSLERPPDDRERGTPVHAD